MVLLPDRDHGTAVVRGDTFVGEVHVQGAHFPLAQHFPDVQVVVQVVSDTGDTDTGCVVLANRALFSVIRI